MKVEILNKQTHKEVEKPKTIRVYPDGEITLSNPAIEHLDVEEGEKIEFLVGSEKNMYKLFIAKSTGEDSLVLRDWGDGGLRVNSSGVAKRIINHFGLNEGDKSLRLGIYPEQHEFLNDKGFKAYQITIR